MQGYKMVLMTGHSGLCSTRLFGGERSFTSAQDTSAISMAAAFGFSVGEFLAAIDVIIKVTKLLRSSSTAPAEYQASVAFLLSVQHTVQKVQSMQHVGGDAAGSQHIHGCAAACAQQVIRFAKRLEKFKDDLNGKEHSHGDAAPWRRPTKSLAKVKWGLVTKEELAELQSAVGLQLSVMQLFLQLADAHEALLARSRDEMLLQITRQTQIQVQQIIAYVEPQAVAGAEQDVETNGQGPCLDVAIRNHAIDTKVQGNDVYLQLGVVTLGLEKLALLVMLYLWHLGGRLYSAATAMPKSPTWLLDTNMLLTDALGRRISLPYEHFKHWSMVQARLNVAFQGCAGESMTRRGAFILFQPRAVDQMIQAPTWAETAGPGARYEMAMTIHSQAPTAAHCPLCHQIGRKGLHGWTSCDYCKLQHRTNETGPLTPVVSKSVPAQPLDQGTGAGSTTVSAADLEARLNLEKADIPSFKFVYWSLSRCCVCNTKFCSDERMFEHVGKNHRPATTGPDKDT